MDYPVTNGMPSTVMISSWIDGTPPQAHQVDMYTDFSMLFWFLGIIIILLLILVFKRR